uniref:(northern house mosquito) hypothetical protein n=1 Tax=Culex pipiens TaxID=7175 RepID=A0A8D8JUT9_CULPI
MGRGSSHHSELAAGRFGASRQPGSPADCAGSTVLGHDAPAGQHRRLHRLLLVDSSRHQRGNYVPRQGKRPNAKLEAPPRGISRPGQFGGRIRNANPSSPRPNPAR